jgi:hypothetical protein
LEKIEKGKEKKGNLKKKEFKHKMVHFQCFYCRFCFSSKGERLTHIRSDHPFRCLGCNSEFQSIDDKIAHQDREGHYVCMKCPERPLFQSFDLMKEHNTMSHQRHRCFECKNISFKEREELIEHLKKTHPKCRNCGDKFGSRKELYAHISSKVCETSSS